MFDVRCIVQVSPQDTQCSVCVDRDKVSESEIVGDVYSKVFVLYCGYQVLVA